VTTYVIPAPRSPVVDLDHLEHALDLALTEELRPPVVAPAEPPVDPWWVRFRAALADGDEDERYRVLEHCREQGWCHDDLAWRAALTVLCTELGRTEEARRELEAIADRCLEAQPRDATWHELAANLAEAAVSLGDTRRADRLRRA
jgi:hypothetical protein